MRKRDKLNIILVGGFLLSTFIYNTFGVSCCVAWLLYAKIFKTLFVVSLVCLNLTKRSPIALILLSSLFTTYNIVKLVVMFYSAFLSSDFYEFMQYISSMKITCIFVSIFFLTILLTYFFIIDGTFSRKRRTIKRVRKADKSEYTQNFII